MQHTHSGFPIRLATERFDAPARGWTESRTAWLRAWRSACSARSRCCATALRCRCRPRARRAPCSPIWQSTAASISANGCASCSGSCRTIRAARCAGASRASARCSAMTEDMLKADRNTVQLCLDNVGIGYAGIRGLTQLDLNACPLSLLESCAAQFAGPFLADLSLAPLPRIRGLARGDLRRGGRAAHPPAARADRADRRGAGTRARLCASAASSVPRQSESRDARSRFFRVRRARAPWRRNRRPGRCALPGRDRSSGTSCAIAPPTRASRVLPLHRPGLRPRT